MPSPRLNSISYMMIRGCIYSSKKPESIFTWIIASRGKKTISLGFADTAKQLMMGHDSI